MKIKQRNYFHKWIANEVITEKKPEKNSGLDGIQTRLKFASLPMCGLVAQLVVAAS